MPAHSAPSGSKTTFKIRLPPPVAANADAPAAALPPAPALAPPLAPAPASTQADVAADGPITFSAPAMQEDVWCAVVGCGAVDRQQARRPHWRRGVGGLVARADLRDVPETWALAAPPTVGADAPTANGAAPPARGFPLCAAHAQARAEWRRARGAPPRFSQHLPRFAAAPSPDTDREPEGGGLAKKWKGPAGGTGPASVATAPTRAPPKASAKKVDLRAFLKKNKAKR
jgi:hypothetical protein